MKEIAMLIVGGSTQQRVMNGSPDDTKHESYEYDNADAYADLISQTFIDSGGCHHGAYNLVVLLKDDVDFYGQLKNENALDMIERSLKYVNN